MLIRVGSWSEHLFEMLNMQFLMYVRYDNIYIENNMLYSKGMTRLLENEWQNDCA